MNINRINLLTLTIGLVGFAAWTGSAHAEGTVITTTQTVSRPVVVVSDTDSLKFEGEILSVDYGNRRILVQEPAGRERRVDVKQGMINNYKVGDYVEIDLMQDGKEAKMIRKVDNVQVLEGRIVALDTVTGRLQIQNRDGRAYTVVMQPGTLSQFNVGEHVRVYAADQKPVQVRFIRVIQ